MTLIDISTNFKTHNAKTLGKFDKTDYSNTETFMAKKKKKGDKPGENICTKYNRVRSNI